MMNKAEDYSVRDLIRLSRNVDKLAGQIILTVIGQGPSISGRFAMFPFPKQSAGWHLHQMMGINMDEYLAIDRRNLIDRWLGSKGKGDVFPIHEARANAKRMTPTLCARNVLFLGRGVASAFGKSGRITAGKRHLPEMLEWCVDQENNYEYAIFPHPSRVNQWWNDPINVKCAVLFMKRCYTQRFYRARKHG